MEAARSQNGKRQRATAPERHARRKRLDPEQLAQSLEQMGLGAMPDYWSAVPAHRDRIALISGAVNGDQVKWTYQSHWGLIKFDVLYAGKLTGAAMKGTVGTAGHVGVFTAAKE